MRDSIYAIATLLVWAIVFVLTVAVPAKFLFLSLTHTLRTSRMTIGRGFLYLALASIALVPQLFFCLLLAQFSGASGVLNIFLTLLMLSMLSVIFLTGGIGLLAPFYALFKFITKKKHGSKSTSGI